MAAKPSSAAADSDLHALNFAIRYQEAPVFHAGAFLALPLVFRRRFAERLLSLFTKCFPKPPPQAVPEPIRFESSRRQHDAQHGAPRLRRGSGDLPLVSLNDHPAYG